jgi:hypothetical protein
MADITYSRTFQHADWVDNEDVVKAGGEKGFNHRAFPVAPEWSFNSAEG